jgi:hypothetical protein
VSAANIETAARVALVVAVVLTCLVARATYRIGTKVAHRVGNRLVDRAVDAVLFVLLFRWLRNRQPAPRPRPAVLTGDDIYLACPMSRWQGDPMACRWCNGLLPPRATRWCTAQCRIVATTNHDYRLAHDAALERDHHTCTRAGCGATASFDRAIETNHIELARGRHDQPGCIHHLSNLESLCGRHHDEVTAGQRARGWAS